MGSISKIDVDKIPQNYQAKWLILWDGDCGFCRRSVDWALKHDEKKQLIAEPYQNHVSWLPQNIVALSTKQVHLLDPHGNFWGGSEAVRLILQLDGYDKLASFLGLPLIGLCSSGGYRLVAANRRFFSRFIFRK